MSDRPGTNRLLATDYSSQVALAASKVAKAAAGNLYGFFGYNDGPDQFILIFDDSTLPIDGTAPAIAAIAVKSKQWFSFDAGEHPIPFENGCVICNSSTAATKTIGAADCQFTVQYK